MTKSQMEIVHSIMKRDKVSEFEAKELVQETIDAINEELAAGGTLSNIEDIIMDYLGLEPDYLMDLIG